MSRRCKHCGETKDLAHFETSVGTWRGYCKPCHRIRQRERYDRVGMSLRDRYANCRNGARYRGLSFTLTFEQFCTLVHGVCVYGKGEYIKGILCGVDRANNDRGYEWGNCHPCCPRHNEIKSDVFTYEQMRHICDLYNLPCGAARAGRRKLPRNK
jgi:hypothetical protein